MKLTSIIYLSSLVATSYAIGCVDHVEDLENCPATVDGECCANTGAICEQVPCPTTTSNPEDPTTTCICPTYPTFTLPPITSHKSKGTKSKGSKPVGNGIGSCDCNGGVAELRYVYLGITPNVQIDIYTGKAKDGTDLVCTFTNIQPNEEIICNLRGDATGLVYQGLSKFATESPFIITYPDGSTCNAQYHTSCSQDIVGIIQPECIELIVSGWRDNDNYDSGLDCDDGIESCQCGDNISNPMPTATSVEIIGEKCYCESDTSATSLPTVTTAPKSKAKKSKGKSKGKKGKSNDVGFGVGDCDCEGGQIELTIMYQGIEDVNIEFYYKDMTLLCIENGVSEGDEVICNVQTPTAPNAPIYEKLGTNTYVRLTNVNTPDIEVCKTEIHTSCSRDIVGTYGDNGCGMDIIVTGWRDKNNLIDGLKCDDGLELCQCHNTQEPIEEPSIEEPVTEEIVTEKPVTEAPATEEIVPEDSCFCPTISQSQDLTITTLPPYKSKGKSKDKSKGKHNGHGYGGCDCDGGINMLRFVYTGSASPVDITLFYDGLDSDIICTINNVFYGDENECALDIDGPFDTNNDPLYSKLTKETFVRIIDSQSTYLCEGQWHTSCSKDIVGWTSVGCDDIIISGWKGNNNVEECDDGFDPCECDNDCEIYSIEQIEGAPSDCEMKDNCYIDGSICKSNGNALGNDKLEANEHNDVLFGTNGVSNEVIIVFGIIIGFVCVICVICGYICIRKKNKKERNVLRKGMEVVNDQGEGKEVISTVETHVQSTDTNIFLD